MDYKEKSKELRRLIIEMVHAAKSGHPGGSLSAVEIMIALFYDVMKLAPKEAWDDIISGKKPVGSRTDDADRFVLSKGHAAPVLYAVLADKGYFPKDDITSLRKMGSHLQGHPDCKKTPGVDVNSGSLGQGASVAVGMAMAEKYKAAAGLDAGAKAGANGEVGTGANAGTKNIYALLGDGECAEGLVWEAAEAAAHYKLDNLAFILDNNGLQIDGTNDEVMALRDASEKFKAFGWAVDKVDGHDVDALITCLKKKTPGMPHFIQAKTIKGKGVSFMENQVGWHGKAPNDEEYEKAMQELK